MGSREGRQSWGLGLIGLIGFIGFIGSIGFRVVGYAMGFRVYRVYRVSLGFRVVWYAHTDEPCALWGFGSTLNPNTLDPKPPHPKPKPQAQNPKAPKIYKPPPKTPQA